MVCLYYTTIIQFINTGTPTHEGKKFVGSGIQTHDFLITSPLLHYFQLISIIAAVQKT